GELAAVLGRPGHVLLEQAPGGGDDRRERRAQVVRDGVEELGLQLVRPPEDLRLGRLAPQPGPLQRDPKLQGNRREEAVVARSKRWALRTSDQEERARPLPRSLHRHLVQEATRGPRSVLET